MATPNTSFSMGKYVRLFVAKNAAAIDETVPPDTDFTLVENENEIELSWKSDKEKISTKSKGRVTLPEGNEEWQIKATADAVLEDAGYANLLATMSGERYCQLRDTKTDKVVMEGKFTASDASMKWSATGVRQTTFTLDNSDTVKLHLVTGGRTVGAAA